MDEPVTKRYTVREWLRTWYELYSKPNLRETTYGNTQTNTGALPSISCDFSRKHTLGLSISSQARGALFPLA